jgi:hypothetical protein
MWGPAGEKGVFLSYWLNAAKSDPTSWKCGVKRGPHRCSKSWYWIILRFVRVSSQKFQLYTNNCLGLLKSTIEPAIFDYD